MTIMLQKKKKNLAAKTLKLQRNYEESNYAKRKE